MTPTPIGHVSQTYLGNGHYRLDEEIRYYSPRFKKWVVVKVKDDSDGATGAFDIISRAWWVHDELCKTGRWHDGSVISNWDCSQVLQDILAEEGRWARAKYWFWATWLIGGGKARKNGMLSVAVVVLALILPGCAYNSVNITADNGARVDCKATVDKPVSIDTLRGNTVSPSGNTVPLSGI